MCRVTPPGYVHEYGETSAIRMVVHARARDTDRGAGGRFGPARIIIARMPTRHFVKYTFLKVDPAWRRLDDERRAADKREFIAACEDFADGHLLRAFSLVGHPRRRRPDAAQPGCRTSTGSTSSTSSSPRAG